MTLRGHVKNGQIQLDEPADLPEGAKVSVAIEPVDEPGSETGGQHPTVWQKLLELAGTVENPEDWAENHDHYIHGTPKRK